MLVLLKKVFVVIDITLSSASDLTVTMRMLSKALHADCRVLFVTFVTGQDMKVACRPTGVVTAGHTQQRQQRASSSIRSA